MSLSTKICHASGPTDHPLLALVGEAPGQEEISQGRPFCGKSGDLLDRMLYAAGISRSQCYLTNVSNIRPYGGRFREYFYSDTGGKKPKEVLMDHRARVSRELRDVQPKVTVLMGEEPLRALANRMGIMEQRGMMIDSTRYGHDVRYMPT